MQPWTTGLLNHGGLTSVCQANVFLLQPWMDYDVFLNHRGLDVKAGFIAHLDEALRTAGLNQSARCIERRCKCYECSKMELQLPFKTREVDVSGYCLYIFWLEEKRRFRYLEKLQRMLIMLWFWYTLHIFEEIDRQVIVIDNSQCSSVLTIHGLLQDLGHGIGMDDGSHLWKDKAVNILENNQVSIFSI